MRYRKLGKTGPEVSVIGFGCWGIGGNAGGAVAYGAVDDVVSRAALRRARERGITFFDTSDLYGFGHSEEVLGEALAGERSKVVLETKVGMIEGGKRQDFSREHILRSIDGSLARLKTDRADLYLLHNPSLADLESKGDPLGVLEELRAQKRVRAAGVSLRSPEDGLAIVGRFPVSCVQINFNLTDQRAMENGLFAKCAKNGVVVVVRTPLVGGFLTGKYADAKAFGEFDQRRRWSQAQVDRWNEAGEIFRAIMAKHPEDTPAQFALRFCLSFPEVSTVIPGMLTPEQVDENAAAGDGEPLPRAELDAILETYKSVEFFVK